LATFGNINGDFPSFIGLRGQTIPGTPARQRLVGAAAAFRQRRYCDGAAAERIHMDDEHSRQGALLPVTARLSRKFYERFGDEIAGEFVDWFNAVDSTYQQQLRELNDLNWERFKRDASQTRAIHRWSAPHV